MIQMLHSGWAYIALLVLIVAVINAAMGFFSDKEFKEKDLRIPLFTLIVFHLQLIIGLIGYYTSNYYDTMRSVGMGEVMKKPELRLMLVEHPIMMILAIILITMGFSKHKKQQTDKGRFKTILLYYGIALLLVLSRIPWGNWFS
jgi:membrane protease YdiL (CAAX protease family)